jgi:hypothetical protein
MTRYKHHGNRVVTRDSNEPETVSIDADLASADWTKQSWDLPPYKSPEFMALFPDLASFRKSPVYNHAVAAGLIMDDEWMADHVEPHN